MDIQDFSLHFKEANRRELALATIQTMRKQAGFSVEPTYAGIASDWCNLSLPELVKPLSRSVIPRGDSLAPPLTNGDLPALAAAAAGQILAEMWPKSIANLVLHPT